MANWKLTPRQCLSKLRKAGVRFKKPAFSTPKVRTPLLLIGPIAGVEIKPRWPKNQHVNAVMDCHLMLALVEVARQASRLGVKKILYYSTYRPLREPPDTCKRGKAGSHCRKQKRAYRKAKRSPSQHRKALAIDIRWFVTDSGETIDVLEDFERRRHRFPCDTRTRTDKGRLLQQFACSLHYNETFNVMLTPNANKAHHNHFHFDITPDATWYILR
ncbi:MAG: extensin family protein [Proteobacteria bacterium]|nr:extensin family protein [Pseudomonadota bacterium]